MVWIKTIKIQQNNDSCNVNWELFIWTLRTRRLQRMTTISVQKHNFQSHLFWTKGPHLRFFSRGNESYWRRENLHTRFTMHRVQCFSHFCVPCKFEYFHWNNRFTSLWATIDIWHTKRLGYRENHRHLNNTPMCTACFGQIHPPEIVSRHRRNSRMFSWHALMLPLCTIK